MKRFHEHLTDSVDPEGREPLNVTVMGGDDKPAAIPDVYVTVDPRAFMGIHFRLSPAGARRMADLLIKAAAAADGDTGDPLQGIPGPFYRGGANKDGFEMIRSLAAFRDVGGLTNVASLMFSQLLLNIAGHVGFSATLKLISDFIVAADVPKSETPS